MGQDHPAVARTGADEAPQTLAGEELRTLLAPLAAADARLTATYPGVVPGQPAHTCYVPADRLRVDEAQRWGEQALALLDEHAPDASALSSALGWEVTEDDRAVLLRLLRTRPVQDLRVDLEDGYGRRPDAEEDAAVDAAVAALAASADGDAGLPHDPADAGSLTSGGSGVGQAATGSATPSSGVRIKALEGATAVRSARTLDRWLTARAARDLGPGIVTLPKVQAPEQVAVAVSLLERLEERLALPPVALELQIETAAGVVGADGRLAVPVLLEAGRGRVTGLHFGTYDYTASLGLAPSEQALDAPVADAAKDLLQLAAAGRGVAVSDGSSNLLPIGDRVAVHAAWREHSRLVARGTARGLWQGWDLHPGQLVSRWVTLAAFYRTRLPEVRERLAGRRPGVADEPATVRMLEALVERAAALGLASSRSPDRAG